MHTFPHLVPCLAATFVLGCGYAPNTSGTGLDAVHPAAPPSDDEHEPDAGWLEQPARRTENVVWSDAVGGARVVAADFDGEGSLDIAVPGFGSDVATLFWAEGDGRLSARGTLHRDHFGAVADTLTAADCDGDGVSELVYLSTRSTNDTPRFARITTVHFAPDGTAEARSSDFAGHAHTLALADYDRDGVLDAIVGYAGSNVEPDSGYTLARLRGQGDGTFALGESVRIENLSAWTMAVLDADTTRPLLAVGGADAGSGQGTLRLLSIDGAAPRESMSRALPLIPGQMTAAELDGEPGQELVLVDRGRSLLAVMDGQAHEVVSDAFLVSDSYALAGVSVAADLDGDQVRELVFAATSRRSTEGFEPGPALVVLAQHGELMFEPRHSLQFGSDPQEFGAAAVAADFDGDGREDVGLLTDHTDWQGRFGVLLAKPRAVWFLPTAPGAMFH